MITWRVVKQTWFLPKGKGWCGLEKYERQRVTLSLQSELELQGKRLLYIIARLFKDIPNATAVGAVTPVCERDENATFAPPSERR